MAQKKKPLPADSRTIPPRKRAVRRSRGDEDLRALRESEEKYRSIVESMQTAIYRSDLGGNVIFANSYAARMLGWPTAESMIGRNIARDFYYRPGDREAFLRALSATGSVSSYEVTLKRRDDGRPVVVSADCRYSRDKDGAVIGVEGIYTDITERKRAEGALSRIESEMRLIFKNMLNAFVIFESVFDGQGNYVSFRFGFFNDAYARISRLKLEEVRGKDVFEVWPATEKSWVETYGSVAVTGQPRVFEMYHEPTQGWYHCNAYRPTDSTDRVCVIFEDITQRRLAYQELAKSEERFSRAFRSSPAAMAITEQATGRFVDANERWERLVGHSRDELIGHTGQELGIMTDWALREDVISELRLNGSVRDMPYKVTTKSGAVRDILWTIESITIGGVDCALSLMDDVTEKKQAEKEKAHLEEMLMRSQKMEAMGTMAGGIAHDFNNILSGIFGYSELALEVKENPPQTTAYIGEILKASERARDLIARILTFSRRAEPVLAPIVVRDVVQETVALIRASTPAAVEMRVSLESGAMVMAEASLIQQVMLNVCNNAIYAMKSGPGVLTISLEDEVVDGEFALHHPGTTPGEHVTIRISDTGAGIAPAVMDHIFEPFFTTKPQGEGTGLGLSVVHGIVKRLSGSITVYSEPGRGTVVHVMIPRIGGEKTESQPGDEAVRGGNERVLLVDDEGAICAVLGRILESLGYTVKAFTDCREALEEMRRNPDGYDVVVTDYSMPFMTGLELADRIREARKDIPIIMSSGYLSREREEPALREGVNVVLAKPVRTRRLAQALRSVLGGRQAGS